MLNIDQLVTLKALAEWYDQKVLTLPPFLTESYFPGIKIGTDLVQYLVSHGEAPKLAKASTYDAQPVPVNREEFEKETFSTSFFRNTMALNENDLEELNRALFNSDDALVDTVLRRIFDDETKQLLGHRARREWMGMQALMTGEIKLASGGVKSSVTYQTRDGFNSTSNVKWTDTAKSTPIDDLQSAIDAMKKVGIVPNQVVMNTETFRLIQRNESVKATLLANNANTPNVRLTQSQAVDYLQTELHITPVIYDQGFIDKDATGNDDFTPYVPTGKIALFNAPIPEQFALTGTGSTGVVDGTQPIGHMAFAPTPEELAVRNGELPGNTVQTFDIGVTYHVYYDQRMARKETLVSMNCLPTFEGSLGVFRMTVTDQPDSGTDTATEEPAGDSGASK
ncbi:major capsid protein [Lactiplantibacillus paraxiangfangensis]|uniref:major capsid protein n=1 Tax=Lactiplantibacillus paraxiangfangensis TaxID=3076224 RepID=UPI0030C70773